MKLKIFIITINLKTLAIQLMFFYKNKKENLSKINKDFKFWISIENTNIINLFNYKNIFSKKI